MGVIKDILRTMDYGPSPEGGEHVRAWLEEHEGGFGHFINGVFTKPADLFDVFNPATGERIARVSQGSAKDIDAAVAAARKAQAKWAALSGFERSKHLYALARHVQKRERFLSVLETIDNGKPIRELRDIDIPLVARHFYHHAGWASLIDSEFPGTKPVGVCGQIIPWNFPLLMLAWKIAPALAAGNTVVLKPAEFTPLTRSPSPRSASRRGCRRASSISSPATATTGAALVAHPGVDKIAFTGSTEVGRAIRKATAGTGKKLSLELGGKSPFIVFEDADLDSAVEGVVDAIWFNSGAGLLRGFAAPGRRERRRNACTPSCAPAWRTCEWAIRSTSRPTSARSSRRFSSSGSAGSFGEGEQEGLEFFRADDSLPDRGCFYPPTLVTGVDPASVLAREEIFGPVLVATTFRTPDEAVALANNTRYGLAASVWTENVNRALRGRGPHQGGRRVDQFDQPVRRRLGLRRLSRKRLRPRGRARGFARVSCSRRAEGQAEPGASASPHSLAGRRADPKHRRCGHRPHRQDVCRRQAGAAQFRLQLCGSRSRRTRGRTCRPRQPQGHPQRGRSGGEGRLLGSGDGA